MTEPTCAHAPTATSPLREQFWGFGVFAVRDGRITLWRDYFDFVSIVKAIKAIRTVVRAVAATAVPALRPSF